MKYTAKQKWVTFFKSLWTPTIYLVLQVGIGLFMFFPLLIVTVAKMLADPDGILPDASGITGELMGTAAFVDMLMLLTALSGILMTVYMVFYYRKKKGISYASLGITDIKPKSAVLGALLGVGTMLTIAFLLNVIYQIFDIGIQDETSSLISAASPLWAMVATVAVAPVVEEFIFRGFMFERLSKVFSPRMTVLLTAIAFGVIHMNLIQSSYAFVAGLLFGYYRAKYEDLWGCILFHIFGNFCGSFDFSVLGEYGYLIAFGVGIVVLIGTLIFMLVDKEKGMFKKTEPQETEAVVE